MFPRFFLNKFRSYLFICLNWHDAKSKTDILTEVLGTVPQIPQHKVRLSRRMWGVKNTVLFGTSHVTREVVIIKRLRMRLGRHEISTTNAADQNRQNYFV
jgi:hypothetical protein